jgi:hypothetical protein
MSSLSSREIQKKEKETTKQTLKGKYILCQVVISIVEKKMKEGREMDMQICKFIESGH